MQTLLSLTYGSTATNTTIAAAFSGEPTTLPAEQTPQGRGDETSSFRGLAAECWRDRHGRRSGHGRQPALDGGGE